VSSSVDVIPVVLFTYARPVHLRRVLACLRADEVPLIYAYADGAKGAADADAVEEVRAILRAQDWCRLCLIERPFNIGLGRNVLVGVTEVAAKHGAFIVFEDDLVCTPGTYAWMCAALRAYAGEPRVLSVTGWTHPRVTPPDVGDAPFFDARTESWSWGSWSRAWHGMNDGDALAKMRATKDRGLAPGAYGADLPLMARQEARKNIWAVRWVYHHFAQGGLCVHPPWSMVDHVGFDVNATNAVLDEGWSNAPLRPTPPIPRIWPEPREHPDCRHLRLAVNPGGWRMWRKRIHAGLVRRWRVVAMALTGGSHE
jgi:hypothetical protein